MRKLFETTYDGIEVSFQASDWTGLEEVTVNGAVVSTRRNFRLTSSPHVSDLPNIGEVTLHFELHFDKFSVAWHIIKDDRVLAEGEAPISLPFAKIPDEEAISPKPSGSTKASHWVAFVGIAFKLFKSGGAIKVALAGTAFAGWSFLLNWQVAAIIISIIVFHEYGHVRAMKKCGLETKGIYLIPFFGGVAVGDRAKTYWHEVYISMMGPVFGLFMSVAFLLAYLVTQIELLGLVATFSALVNLFNLLPVYPLDGGHVLKAACLSFQGRASWIMLVVVSAAGFAFSIWVGLYFLGFFFMVGALDLLSAQSSMRDSDVVPMKPYGVLVSIGWLFATAGIFIAMIVYIANTGIPGGEIPLRILED